MIQILFRLQEKPDILVMEIIQGCTKTAQNFRKLAKWKTELYISVTVYRVRQVVEFMEVRPEFQIVLSEVDLNYCLTV